MEEFEYENRDTSVVQYKTSFRELRFTRSAGKIPSSGFQIFTPGKYKLKGRGRGRGTTKADITRLLLSSRDPIPYLPTGLQCFIHR